MQLLGVYLNELRHAAAGCLVHRSGRNTNGIVSTVFGPRQTAARHLGEFLGNLSPIIGPNSQIDTGGQSYIARQTVHLAEKYNNTIELMTTGMFQDNLYFQLSGDNLLPVIGAPTGSNIGVQIPFQIPSGNKNQLNILGTGNIVLIGWQNVAV